MQAHIPKTHFTPWPYKRSLPPLSHPAVQLFHSSYSAWDLVSMDPFQEGPWSLGTLCSSALHSSFIFPHFLLYLNSWVFILLQFTVSVFMWPSRSFCVHCNLTAMLFALDCYNSVILDSILDEYLLKHSKDLFTRHGLYYGEVPILGLVPFSPQGQRLCLPSLL